MLPIAFAFSFGLGIAGLLMLQWSFLAGVIMIVIAVGIHARLPSRAEDAFIALMMIFAFVGIVVEVGAEIWRRLFM